MTDLRLIRHFESVFRLGSFSKAADELGLSQSALTKSIQTLEANWDVTLFHRTTRSIAATDAGKRLYPMGVDLLAHAETVKRETREGERALNIVCGPAILDTLIQPAIEAFRDAFPLTRVSAETMPPAHAVEELIQRRVHLLLYHLTTIDGLPHARRLKTAELFSEPYVVACRPGHAVLETDRSLTSLLKFEWAIAGYDPVFESGLPKDIRDVLLASNFPKYRLLSQPACLEMTRRTNILSSAPQSVIAPLVASGDLHVFPHPANLKFSIGAASLIETWQEPVVRGFVDSLRSSCLNRLD
jgi:DNA-binding transcriptional LysR family regulator